MEGLLNISWGLRRPIRLQMQDDHERFHFANAGFWKPESPGRDHGWVGLSYTHFLAFAFIKVKSESFIPFIVSVHLSFNTHEIAEQAQVECSHNPL